MAAGADDDGEILTDGVDFVAGRESAVGQFLVEERICLSDQPPRTC
jgi:hypothetical protein